jgi:hypothetical protein
VPLFIELRRTSQPVEKVPTGPIDGTESGSKRPENGALGARTGIKKGHEEVFQQAHPFFSADW